MSSAVGLSGGTVAGGWLPAFLGRFGRVPDLPPSPAATRRIPDPAQVVIPLEYPGQILYRPQVAEGDRVRRHEILGRSEAGNCVHASVAGVVEEIRPVWTARGYHVPAVWLRSEGDDEVPLPELYAQAGLELESATLQDKLRVCGVICPWTLPGRHHLEEELLGLPPVRQVVIKGVNEEPTIGTFARLLEERVTEVRRGLGWLEELAPGARVLITVPRRLERWAREEFGPQATIVPLGSQYSERIERSVVPRITGEDIPTLASYRRFGVGVLSVEYLLALVDALEDRGPFARKHLTVRGAGTAEPVVVDLPLGTPISALLDALGIDAGASRRIVVGGPMKGQAQQDAGTPLTKSSHGLLLMAEEELPGDDHLPCIHCGRCARACPLHLQVHLIARCVEYGTTAEAEAYHPEVCHECGLCGYVCPSHRPLPQIMRLLNRDRG